MGGGDSRLVLQERPRWDCEHALKCDRTLQAGQRGVLHKLEADLKLGYTEHLVQNFPYRHYLITDGKWVLEFGSADGSGGHVLFHVASCGKFILDRTFTMTAEIKNRISQVMGATNFSLALRNSEHLCRYVQSGTWFSMQMTGQSALWAHLKGSMDDAVALVNTLPTDLQARRAAATTSTPLYREWHFEMPWCRQPMFESHASVLLPSESSPHDVNILILGPTGAGKSTITNLLFNQKVALAKPSAMSVTRQMEIYNGVYPVKSTVGGPEAMERRRLRLIDSIGFCDSVLSPKEVMDVTKTFIKVSRLCIYKVIVVCAGRIEAEQAAAIKSIMKWLGYDGRNHKSEFVFLYNKAEGLTDAEKLHCVGEMCDLLGADATHSAAVDGVETKFALALGFPPRAELRDVRPDLENLYRAAYSFRHDSQPLVVDESSCTIL